MSEEVIFILGSKKDRDFIKPATKFLDEFNINYQLRIASAHKTPEKVLEIIKNYEEEEGIVYITVAGRSNALSGFVDANTTFPVIACPPYSDKFSGADIFSSLRMPSGVGPLVVMNPENAALAALKILAFRNPSLSEKIESYRGRLRKKIEDSDEILRE